MKRSLQHFLTSSLSAALLLLLLLSSCTKEGPTGLAGKDGQDGKDANIVCGTCHNENYELSSKLRQYHHSKHYLGITSFENRTFCAPCHTTQGFLETAATGTYVTAANISEPLGITCRTCHNVHKKFDSTDFALTFTNPVKFLYTQETHDFGKANMCGKCHQPRAVNPKPDMTKPNDSLITITSQNWGPHYGTASNILIGKGAFEIAGSEPYTNSKHGSMVENACITCHMASPIGYYAGGHSMNMIFEEEGTQNTAGCFGSGCHESAGFNFNYENTQTEMKTLLAEFRQVLLDKGYLDTTNTHPKYRFDRVKASSSKPLKITHREAAALFNYIYIARDGSLGVHNNKYATAVLKNSKAVFE